MLDENNLGYEECFVGNIIGNHYWGKEKKIVSGTPYFSAGTKVYCAFKYGGMGNERGIVLGRKRKSFKMLEISIRTAYIKNLRVQKVYSPKIIQFIRKHKGLVDIGISEEYAASKIKSVNESHNEIKEGKELVKDELIDE